MVQKVQNVGAVGDGIVHDELQLRRVAQIHLLPQLVAQVAGGGLQALHQTLFVLTVQGADIDPGVPQVAGGVHMGDGQHALGDTGILHRAQQAGQRLADGLIDAADAIGCHSIAPFKNRGWASAHPLVRYTWICSMVKASTTSPSLMSLNFSMLRPHS